MALRGVRTKGDMAPEIDLSQQRPAQFVFSRHVEHKLAEIRKDTSAAQREPDMEAAE